jgi:hypothetical protein
MAQWFKRATRPVAGPPPHHQRLPHPWEDAALWWTFRSIGASAPNPAAAVAMGTEPVGPPAGSVLISAVPQRMDGMAGAGQRGAGPAEPRWVVGLHDEMIWNRLNASMDTAINSGVHLCITVGSPTSPQRLVMIPTPVPALITMAVLAVPVTVVSAAISSVPVEVISVETVLVKAIPVKPAAIPVKLAAVVGLAERRRLASARVC